MPRNPCTVAIVIPPGWPNLVAHHEATSGMGALAPGDAPFLYPPQTAALCAAEMRNAGIQATLVPAARLVEAQRAADFDAVAVLVSHGTRIADEHLLRLISRRSSRSASRPPVVLFGASAHLVSQPWIEEGLARTALFGEPEGAIAPAVLQTIDGQLAGVELCGDLAPGRYRTPYHLADLDELPFPAWDLVPWQPHGAASVLTSRGCPASCAYCAYTVPTGQVFRAQSADRVVEEMTWLARTENPPRVQVRDSVFAHDRARALSICTGLARSGAPLSFACESRPEHFDDELLAALQAAGCATVKIGLESADPGILLRIGRAADAERADASISAAARVSRTCAKLGIGCQVFVMAGLPEQDGGSLRRTEALLRTLPKTTVVRAKPYQWHPEVTLDWPSAPASPETVALLESANRSGGALWRRAARRVFATLRPTGKPSASIPDLHAEPMEVSPQPLAETVAIEKEALHGRTVFLTGGNGFVGGYTARLLAAAGSRIRALVRPGSELGSLAELIAAGAPIEIVRGDLAEEGPWVDALAGCEFCLHVAGAFGGAGEAERMMQANATGTDRLCAACAGASVRRFVHTSTIGTVGRPTQPDALPDETTPFAAWSSASDYVRTKYLGELIAAGWSKQGLGVVIVKPVAPVGAGDARPTATGRRIVTALRGEGFSYPPEGVNHAPVQDIAHGILLAAALGVAREAYILGHLQGNLDRDRFLSLVRTAAGLPNPASPQETPSAGALPAGLTANPVRAVRELGMPQSDLSVAFAEAVRWYRENGFVASAAR